MLSPRTSYEMPTEEGTSQTMVPNFMLYGMSLEDTFSHHQNRIQSIGKLVDITVLFLENGSLRKGWKDKRGRVQCWGVVSKFILNFIRWSTERCRARSASFRGNNEPNLTTWVSRNGSVSVPDSGVGFGNGRDEWADQVKVQPHAL